MKIDEKYKALTENMSMADPALESLFYLLSTARALDEDCLSRLKPFDMSEGRFTVLLLLLQNGGQLAPHELAAKARVSRATMTGLLDTLEKAGHIMRLGNMLDRRALVIALTPTGRNLAEDLRQSHNSWLKTVLTALSADEHQFLKQLLQKIWQQTARGKNEAK